MGYATGTFLSASNNFCTGSFTDDFNWHYVYNNGDIGYDKRTYEASITASCFGKEIKAFLISRLINARDSS